MRAIWVALALLGAALIRAPWITLLVVATLYLVMLPFAFASYQQVKRRRAAAGGLGSTGGASSVREKAGTE